MLYGVQDNYKNKKAKYGEYISFDTWEELAKIPPKFINAKITYRNCYYFDNEKDRNVFLENLVKDKKGENKMEYVISLLNAIVNLKNALNKNGFDADEEGIIVDIISNINDKMEELEIKGKN